MVVAAEPAEKPAVFEDEKSIDECISALGPASSNVNTSSEPDVDVTVISTEAALRAVLNTDTRSPADVAVNADVVISVPSIVTE